MKKAVSFQEFWDAYALKRDRLAAERAWKKLTATDQRAAIAGIAAYREDCQRRGIAMMYAQGYLSHRRWEDEVATDDASEKKTPIVVRPSLCGNDTLSNPTDGAFDNMNKW